MAITLTVEVRDADHNVLRSFEDAPDEPFLEFCRIGSTLGVRYVDFIHPYSDSMLNFFQLDAWLEDLPRVLVSGQLDPKLQASVGRVLEASR